MSHSGQAMHERRPATVGARGCDRARRLAMAAEVSVAEGALIRAIRQARRAPESLSARRQASERARTFVRARRDAEARGVDVRHALAFPGRWERDGFVLAAAAGGHGASAPALRAA